MLRPRVGLVLGGGGAVGHAFHAGVLSALCDRVGFEPRGAEVIVGTSAGSIVAALLRAGIGPDDLAAQALDEPLSPRARELWARVSSVTPPTGLPGRRAVRLGLSSPGILAGLALRPWEVRPGLLAAALLPEGGISTEVISAWMAPLFDGWPPQALWVCAVALANGRRVVFGAPGDRLGGGAEVGPPGVQVAEAVAASCAIPGFFAPVEIAGVRYIDGGVHSSTNADLLAGYGLDLVVVSSPMSATGRLRIGLDAAGRRMARVVLGQEVAALRRRGTKVLAFQPTPEDQAVMGLHAMDQSRRAVVTRQARDSTLRRLKRPDLGPLLAVLRDA